MGKNCRIIIVASFEVFNEVAKMLKYSLKEIGFDKIVIEDSKESNIREYYDLNIVIKALRPYPDERNINGYKVLFQTEELWNRRERGFYDLSSGYDKVLEMYDENVRIPNGTKNVVYCPVGWSPVFENNLKIPENQDIDVLFWGSGTDRRKQFEKVLIKEGYNCRFYMNKSLFGNEREELIMRSKIILNIKAHDKWSFGPIHCLPAIANNKFILTEKANGGYGPFVPNRHFIEYNGINDLLKKLKYWLPKDEERYIFSSKALDLVKKECNFTDIFKKSLNFNIDINNKLIIEKTKRIDNNIFNIIPGMSTWVDTTPDYKTSYYKYIKSLEKK